MRLIVRCCPSGGENHFLGLNQGDSLLYRLPMLPHKIWMKQCRATPTIRRRFGVKSALDYLLSEKLVAFAAEADRSQEFAKELPRFQAAVWKTFNPYEIAGYVQRLKPKARMRMRKLLFLR